MFDWLGLVLAVMKFVNMIMNYVDREQLKQDGRNELLAEQSMMLLQRTERGKKIMEKVDAMDESDVDAEFARLARVRGKKGSAG